MRRKLAAKVNFGASSVTEYFFIDFGIQIDLGCYISVCYGAKWNSMKRKERITWTPSTTTSLSTTRLTSSSTRSAPAATSENPSSSHELSLNLEEGTVRDGNMGSEEGRLVGMIGKIQNLSSSVGFITRTLEGNCLYVIRYNSYQTV